MYCEVCSDQVATVHLTEIANKKKKEVHLCEECAKEQGYSVKSFSPADLLGELVEPTRSAREKYAGVGCPVCGITYSEFRSTGRLGCANDYQVFRDALSPLLEKMHGHTQHIGKIPQRVGDRIEQEKQLLLLRQKLNRAVQREEYEKAAELRDKIQEMEDELGDEPGE